MRSIKQLHKAVYAPIDDLVTYRALPTRSIQWIDPFLFLNHHGPQCYEPFNRGLPFGPHPHRGFETLTFVLQGDIMHRDTGGGKSVIQAGGVQWMTAGRGLIHAEESSDAFKETGGMEEVIQIWMNLPARLKMTTPEYKGLPKEEIPTLVLDGGKVTVHLISGMWNDVKGPIISLTNLLMAQIDLRAGGRFQTEVESVRNLLFYVVNGKVTVNGQLAETHTLVEFGNDSETIEVEALEDATLIFGHGQPFNEPIVAQGPFVMNTQTEIMQAMRDYQMGKMGVWTE